MSAKPAQEKPTSTRDLVAAALRADERPAATIKRLKISHATYYYYRKKIQAEEGWKELAVRTPPPAPLTVREYAPAQVVDTRSVEELARLRAENTKLRRQVHKLVALLLADDD